jgi:hypothetical protein
MPIRFKCPNCKKALAVKEQMAGKKAACPACKKPLIIPNSVAKPAPISKPVDVENFAAELFAEASAPKAEEKPKSIQTIDFICPFCEADLHLPAELGGKKEPCPQCKNILKVPMLVKEQAKDWRTVEKTGPSGAAGKAQPELAGAWGSTTNKGKVSLKSLEEADAIIYEDDEEAGVGRWIKRISIIAALAGLILLIVWGINRRQRNREQKDHMARALDVAENAKIKDRLPAAWTAQIHRAAGEFFARKKDQPVDKTQIYFKLARFPLIVRPEDKQMSLDFDLALARGIASQIDLAGTQTEVEDKLRLEWNTIYLELLKSLQRVRPVEGKVLALRALADKLVVKKQGFQAVNLARSLYEADPKRALLAQWVAFAHDPNMQDKKKDLKAEAIKKLPPPNPNLNLDDEATRTAYAEGLAREGNFAEALQIVQAPGGRAQDRMQAALAVANVARDKSPEESGLKIALDLANGDLKDNIPPWLGYELVKATVRAGLVKEAKEIAKKLPPEFKSWGELEIFQGQLAKKEDLAPADMIEEITDPNSLPRALAWEAWARHNTRLGYKDDVDAEWDKVTDHRFRPFLDVGIALGVQDRTGR